MHLANNKKLETIHDGRNRTTKSRENQNVRRKRKLRILGNIENRKHKKKVDLKEKITNEYLRRTKRLLEIKLFSINLIKGINTWAVPLERCSKPFLKWTKEEI